MKFGTDGIRGFANQELTATLAMKIGSALASTFTPEENHKVVIGKDTRISGDMLVSALIAGLCSSGIDIINLGIIPTPAVSYLTEKYKASAGIAVSASHNPSEYNGIKIFNSTGYKLSDDLEHIIEDKINDPNFAVSAKKVGKILSDYHPIEDYVNHLLSVINIDLTGLNVLIDCANGAATTTAPVLFSRLGCNYTIINANPNGLNINENCGSTHIDTLNVENYDCIIAYDGDADRCIMKDNKGNIIDGDIELAVLGNHMEQNHKLENNIIVGTVMSNLGLIKYCKDNHIKFIATKVGDKYVLEEMLKQNSTLGGEQSGHIIQSRYAKTGDGELTSIKILEIMKKNNKSLEELSKIITKYPQVLINIKVDNDKKNDFKTDTYIQKEIEIISNTLGNNGRVLVRASGTEPLIRIMVEGSNERIIKAYASDLGTKIQNRLK